MLVPVLVLGVMGCGKVFDAGDPLPADLQGTWFGKADTNDEEVVLVLAGNQASVLFVTGKDYTSGPLGNDLKELKGSTPFWVDIGFSGETSYDDPSAGGSTADDDYFTIDFYDFTQKKNNLKGSIRGRINADGGTITVLSSEGENYFYGLPPMGTYTLATE